MAYRLLNSVAESILHDAACPRLSQKTQVIALQKTGMYQLFNSFGARKHT
jgi:hypothetical protein